jgi:UDPglucose 6-dehydrogenase
MKVAVIGTGYVGLVAGVCFAKFGHYVTCIDKDKDKVSRLSEGIPTIHEKDLPKLLKGVIDSSKMNFSDHLDDLDEYQVVVIAVGTPSSSDGSANLNYLNEVVKSIAKVSSKDKVVVIKSTVPVGTATRIRALFKDLSPSVNFDVISNPEFLREGSAVQDFLSPDRVVIGCASENSKNVAKELYRAISPEKIVFVSNPTAELIKYSSNCYLAMRIAFINEMADVAEVAGADIEDVARGMGLDSRIGTHYLKTGPGYGGSCFPKDTLALSHYAHSHKIEVGIVDAVIKSNDQRKLSMAKRIEAEARRIGAKKVAILGLTFKADTDDLRDSASIEIIQHLKQQGFEVAAYDPSKPYEQSKEILGDILFSDDIGDCLKDANVACIVTEWNEFKILKSEFLQKLMGSGTLIDLRNILSPLDFQNSNIKYLSIGR